MSARIYSEEEVARLIRRAVEMEAERSVSREKNSQTGLSLSELEQVAAESGIDPELIHRACHELDAGSLKKESIQKEAAKIKNEEIVCERWLDAQPDPKILEDLVTELNHRYGTSDSDVNWWDRFWDNYAGKAKIRKTQTSLEWHYTDEWEYYTTRVLLQKRGERFRIRVSKRQLWGMEWSDGGTLYTFLLPVAVVSVVIGAVLGFALINSAWAGIAAGAALALASYPFMKSYYRRSVNKHRKEVTDTADDLADLTLQLIDDPFYQTETTKEAAKTDTKVIEIIDQDEEDEAGPKTERLRNNLR